MVGVLLESVAYQKYIGSCSGHEGKKMDGQTYLPDEIFFLVLCHEFRNVVRGGRSGYQVIVEYDGVHS